MEDDVRKLYFVVMFILYVITVSDSATNPSDVKILNDFRNGLDNPELLKWPIKGDDGDPCGPPLWPHVFCSGDRVTQIQVQGLGLKGPLPQNFNQLPMLYNLGLQRNQFSGKLPTFRGLSELQFAFLDYNDFDTIPIDFFDGLTSIRVLALDHNPFNASTGWSLPDGLQKSVQLTNLSLVQCNLVGQLPDYLGTLPSLSGLKLSNNRLSGVIPESFGQSLLQILWLNDQTGGGMTGSIDVIGSMVSLTQLWLHGNQFTGTIPESIGDLSSLKDLNLNGNKLVGLIPEGLAALELDKLDLNNNLFMGPIPKFKSGNVSYAFNSFCQPDPGVQCAPEVNALLDLLGAVNYPSSLASQWSGNDPCRGPWLGLSCNTESKVSVINLPRRSLNGTLSPSIAKLDSLVEIRVQGNNLTGSIPTNFTELKSLRLLDISENKFEPPLPKFSDGVRINTDGNPQLTGNQTSLPPVSSQPTPSGAQSPFLKTPPPPPIEGSNSNPSKSVQAKSKPKISGRMIAVICGALVILAILVSLLYIYCCKKRKDNIEVPSAVVIHPRDPSDPDDMVKIAMSNNTGSVFTQTRNTSWSGTSSGMGNSHVIDSGNLVISVQVLRRVTDNFAPENVLGRGGFGTVYKGSLEDGTKIAVKRMEGGVISRKAVDEFESEIAVLSKVRHRHLVSLLGYSVEGIERLLVYEYMPQGALSKHLFQWKDLKLEPLSWTRRLTIALDVARGVEYLHNLAHESFIHRDLKSSNILLDDDYRAKVSDFGLVKLAPDREKSVATRLAGTFGYLAPEYAVMGKITTKVDVFSFGVVLMELLTGMMALDESRSEERRYLAEWFWQIKSNKDKLLAAIDPTLGANEDTFEAISVLAELAGHCTAREPYHRPDMSYAVNVLGPLVEKWQPFADEAECYSGINYNLPLPQLLKVWQEAESKDVSYSSLNDSKGSLPALATGFATSFMSDDARD